MDAYNASTEGVAAHKFQEASEILYKASVEEAERQDGIRHRDALNASIVEREDECGGCEGHGAKRQRICILAMRCANGYQIIVGKMTAGSNVCDLQHRRSMLSSSAASPKLVKAK